MTIGKEIKRVSVSMNAQFSNQNVDDTENAINSLRWKTGRSAGKTLTVTSPTRPTNNRR